ncbi:hypothetical protein KIH27_04175 [Mycobacterium sp. M1]|uniref:Uncharacterized protein n=1 Tax=Mycolicibacter acidiphilus TaxID=2835306 RepID=A0ABS5RES2_9MYCO|nr:hypothetical protein [Mycolicibacter acidiphilus]MBS9532783.1 hypothetical protein [Mycolicibacter acidiphilus]
MIAVIAVAVTITIVVLHSGSDGRGGKNGTGATSDIVSAEDTGSIGIITDEPTCDKFMPINNALAALEKKGWSDRNPSIPATEWSADQRTQYEEIAAAMRNTADQYVTLAKQTPHRVVRELYEQSIAYARSYADSVPNYTAQDEQLARTFISATNVIVNVCESITYGSAGGRAILADPQPGSHQVPALEDPAKPTRFLTSPDSTCKGAIANSTDTSRGLSEWLKIDASIPATEWTSEQNAINDAASQTMLSSADRAAELATRTKNTVLQDFLDLAAQYQRVYVKAVPTYVAADSYLASAGNQANAIVTAACLAVGG